MLQKKGYILIIAIFTLFSNSYAQSTFEFSTKKQQDKIQFELLNNLIVIPVTMNQQKLFFLLDTGVRETIIFNVSKVDSLVLRKASIIKVKGVNNEVLETIKSENNTLKVGNMISNNHVVYVAFNQQSNLSSYLGSEIHGILGYHFFKNHKIEVSYIKEHIKVYPKNKKLYKQKRYDKLPLIFQRGKPYVNVLLQGKETRLLLDTGMSDSLWLFEEMAINSNYGYYDDFLGFTISGEIYGKRSKINNLKLNSLSFTEVKVAYPKLEVLPQEFYSTSHRLGSLGGEIFKRFSLIIDYSSKNIYFKSNRYFEDSFYYNKSGIVLRQIGDAATKNLNNPLMKALGQKNMIQYVDLSYLLAPEYIIDHVRIDSPSEFSGLLKGDVILKINNVKTHRYTLKEMTEFFYDEDGEVITLEVLRNGKKMLKTLVLRSPLLK